jgi:hypothetical protein
MGPCGHLQRNVIDYVLLPARQFIYSWYTMAETGTVTRTVGWLETPIIGKGGKERWSYQLGHLGPIRGIWVIVDR